MRARIEAARTPLQGALLVALLSCLFALDLWGPSRHGDVDLYHRYAVTFWGAAVPFRQLPAEYPPLSLVAFTLSLIPPAPDYPTVFGLWMAAIFLAGLVLVWRLFSRQAALLYVVYLTVGAAGTLLSRYDLVPALLTLGVLAAVRRDRFNLAYLLVGLGALVKLYPLFLLPALVIEDQRRRRAGSRPAPQVLRGVGLTLGVVAVGLGAAYLLAGPDALAWLGFARSRPFQVESAPASLLWLLSGTGLGVQYDHSFNSYNLLSPASGPVGVVSAAASLAGVALVCWRQVRGGLPFERACLALVCVAVITNHVFSPQYMIWVLPLVAVTEGFDLLWLLVALLTTAIWPIGYLAQGFHGPHPSYSAAFLVLIAVRNLLFLVATWRLLRVRRPAFGERRALALG